ncbi:MAG: molybdopterin converting factor subunit 1 [Gammaproteobacteria bacterium]|nr:molybdopterin converting factor subunit 1 [Gammaproteobacteria bacterium]
MNIQVKFFAQLKEKLGCGELTLSFPSESVTVSEVKSALSSKGSVWQKSLADGHVLMAVNHDLVVESFSVEDGDEVAFFPPVTGG